MTEAHFCNTIYYSMQVQRSIINISMPAAMAKRVAKLAKEENRTISELIREAIRIYEFKRDWSKIRGWGRETALKMNIRTYDDVERIAG